VTAGVDKPLTPTDVERRRTGVATIREFSVDTLICPTSEDLLQGTPRGVEVVPEQFLLQHRHELLLKEEQVLRGQEAAVRAGVATTPMMADPELLRANRREDHLRRGQELGPQRQAGQVVVARYRELPLLLPQAVEEYQV